jgi:hypothetical protein
MNTQRFKKGLRPWHIVDGLRNFVDFPLRSAIRWQRPIPDQSHVDLHSLLSHFPVPIQNKAVDLLREYSLDGFGNISSFSQVQVNLYYLDMFIQAFSGVQNPWPEALTVVDVGPSDWFYLPALYSFLRYYQAYHGRELTLEGYEIDAFRVYADFHARIDHARQYFSVSPSIVYHTNGFSEQPETYDLVVQMFPFVFLKDHLSWGLPLSLFNPPALLAKIEASMKPGSYLLITNQGKEEQTLQKELLQQGPLAMVNEFAFRSIYKEYNKEHLVTVWGK